MHAERRNDVTFTFAIAAKIHDDCDVHLREFIESFLRRLRTPVESWRHLAQARHALDV